jgi:acyl dehydratase
LNPLYYEDIEVGARFVSSGRTITEADVVLFAGLSGDYNPLHINEEFGKTTPFGSRIAHGILGLAVITGLMDRMGIWDGTAIAFLGLEWRFLRPIFIGDTVHFEMVITDKRRSSNPERGILTRQVTLYNQKNEPVQQGIMSLMVKCRNLNDFR